MAHAATRSEFSSDIASVITVMAEEVQTALESYREHDDFVRPARSHLVQARAL
jgi:hypothetical protein